MIDYDDGAGAVDALMTLHGDRPSNSASGSASPSAGSKRPASPKNDALQSVKKSKSASDSPATRTVLEVINTPTGASPAPPSDSAGNGDGYFKGAETKTAESGAETAVPETSEKNVEPSTESTAETAPATSAPVVIEEPKVATPPADPLENGTTEDVAMEDAQQPTATEPAATAQTTEAAPAVEVPSVIAETPAVEPTPTVPAASAPIAAEPESAAMEVDPPAQSERPPTPDLPAPPAPATDAPTTTSDPPTQSTEGEKKE